MIPISGAASGQSSKIWTHLDWPFTLNEDLSKCFKFPKRLLRSVCCLGSFGLLLPQNANFEIHSPSLWNLSFYRTNRLKGQRSVSQVNSRSLVRVKNGNNSSIWGFQMKTVLWFFPSVTSMFNIVTTLVFAFQRGLLCAHCKMPLYRKRRGGGEFWPLKGAIQAIALAAAFTVLVMSPHHETVTMGITLLWFPHEVDITNATDEWSPWLINSFWGCALGPTGRKQIHFILSAGPPHHANIHCAHTCVKLKPSWPYIWVRMLFLLLKRFICRNISGETFSRFGGGGVAEVMATRCCHMYHRRCQQTVMAAEPRRVGVSVQSGCEYTDLFVSIHIH